MERKYSCYFMRDGRAVFIENKDIYESIDAEKELLIIDTHSGEAFAIGADKEVNDKQYGIDSEYIYNMYSRSYNNVDESVSDCSRFNKIVFVKGERIYMKSGNEATDYWNGHFSEYGNYKPDDLNQGYVDIPKDDPCKCVDMKRTIAYFENHVQDGKEKLECMSGYINKGFDWTGTKYKKW